MTDATLRRIEPFGGILPKELPQLKLGQDPEIRWVNPASLMVDESYQRDLTERSVRLIRNIILNFAWRKYKCPIVVEVGPNKELHCIDGQHTAIAAVTLRLPAIPIFIVEAATLESYRR